MHITITPAKAVKTLVQMKCGVLACVAAAAACMHAVTGEAASLRPNKATDSSVCDLSPGTNEFLARRMLIPAVADPKDQQEAYFRMAAGFVVANCVDGQLLILQGPTDIPVDVRSLQDVANSACLVADVRRSEVSTPGHRGEPEGGFELRCKISKHAELEKQLADREKAEPMDTLKARMANSVRAAERGEVHPRNPAASQPADCSKMTLSSLIQGGRNCPK